MLNCHNVILFYLIGINILTFVFFAVDKYRAVHHLWRISEFTLLLLTVIGGGLGAHLSMRIFHHKTKHFRFRFFVPLCMIIQLGCCIYFWFK